MKNLIITLLIALGMQSAKAAADFEKKEISITISNAFIAETIDRDQDAKIVLSGTFPNSCYSWSRTEVSKPTSSRFIIQAKAYVLTNAECLMVIIPYMNEVNLGKLPAGQYVVHFVSGDATYFEKKFTVQ